MSGYDHQASSLLCEVQESSGNSDSGLDTDAYLESLIRKQKIPRTQNYNASMPDSSKSSAKQADLRTAKPKAAATHSNMQGKVAGSSGKLAFKIPTATQVSRPKGLAVQEQESTSSVVELHKDQHAEESQTQATVKHGS